MALIWLVMHLVLLVHAVPPSKSGELEDDRLTPSARPKYLQIADDLRARIIAGEYAVGAALPSTSRLMQVYDVSVTVARAAIKELQNEGVAKGQPGKAVYVQREPAPDEPSAEYREITRQIDDLRATVRQAVQHLDDRLTKLEQTARPAQQSP